MKRLLCLLFLIPALTNARTISQSITQTDSLKFDSLKITIDTIIQYGHCAGDILRVVYHAVGAPDGGHLDSNNRFLLQVTDSLASFGRASFRDSSTKLTDTLWIQLGAGRFRFRMISTSPNDSSQVYDSTAMVLPYPKLAVTASRNDDLFRMRYSFEHAKQYGMVISAGIAGEPITFTDFSITGGTYSWSFGPDASPSTANANRPVITFLGEGIKQGIVTNTLTYNGYSCSTTDTFEFSILGCKVDIPQSTRIVTGVDSGNDRFVRVKHGGLYKSLADSDKEQQTFFVDSGGTVSTNAYETLIYFKPNARFRSINESRHVTLVTEILDIGPGPNIDTEHCSSIVFIPDLGVNTPESFVDLWMRQTDLHVIAGCSEGNCVCHFYNILGTPVLSGEGVGELDIDLSSLASGVYFADIRADGHRIIRKIVR